MEAVTKLPVQSEVHYPTFEDMCHAEADVLFEIALSSSMTDLAVSHALRGAAELTNDRSLSTALVALSKHVVGESDEVSDCYVVAVYDWVDQMRNHREHLAQVTLQEAS